MVEKNMVTLTERTIMKSRSGVYSDTAENRRKHRVGQKYGAEKQPEDGEKTEKKETDPEKELEAVNKVIAAINEGKLNLPAAEVMKLSEKKQKLETNVKSDKSKKKEESMKAAKTEAENSFRRQGTISFFEERYGSLNWKKGGDKDYPSIETKTRINGKNVQIEVDEDGQGEIWIGDSDSPIEFGSMDSPKAVKDFSDILERNGVGRKSMSSKEDRQKIKEEMKEKYDVSSVVKEVKEKLKGLSVESSLELLNKELPNRIQDIYGTYDKELSKFDDVKIKNSIHTVSNSKFESLHAALSKEYDKITEKAISEGIIPDGWKFEPDGRITKKVSVPESEGGGKFSLTVDTKRGNELYVSMTNSISNDKKEEIRSIEQKFSSREEALSFVEKFLGNEPKEKVDTDSEEGGEETEVYTRIKFDDVPNSGKINLKKYLSEKVRKGVDEKWSSIKNIPTENLKKMEKGLVNDLNKNFEAIKKSQRAELLYSIMKVKGELESRGKETSKEGNKGSGKLSDLQSKVPGYMNMPEYKKYISAKSEVDNFGKVPSGGDKRQRYDELNEQLVEATKKYKEALKKKLTT